MRQYACKRMTLSSGQECDYRQYCRIAADNAPTDPDATASPRRHVVTFQEHVAIVDAIEAGKAEAARTAMLAHIEAVMVELEAFSQTHPQVFADREMR